MEVNLSPIPEPGEVNVGLRKAKKSLRLFLRDKYPHWSEEHLDESLNEYEAEHIVEFAAAYHAERSRELREDRDCWRRVAEKLAGEKQAAEARLRKLEEAVRILIRAHNSDDMLFELQAFNALAEVLKEQP